MVEFLVTWVEEGTKEVKTRFCTVFWKDVAAIQQHTFPEKGMEGDYVLVTTYNNYDFIAGGKYSYWVSQWKTNIILTGVMVQN